MRYWAQNMAPGDIDAVPSTWHHLVHLTPPVFDRANQEAPQLSDSQARFILRLELPLK